jgi:hypothetical protein
MKYTEIKNEYGQATILRDNEDGSVSSIPIDLANTDYQEYLAANEPSDKL